jgi:hypothetical protein
VRVYEFCHRESVKVFAYGGETLEFVVKEEPDLPGFVRGIVIKLRNDREYVIESQAPPLQ